MAIYVGGQRYKLSLGRDICGLNICTSTPITNGVRLLSSDDFILRDMNNIYLTVKKEDE